MNSKRIGMSTSRILTEHDLLDCRVLVQEANDLRYRLGVLRAQADGVCSALAWSPHGTKTADHTGDVVCNMDKIERLLVDKVVKILAHIQRVEEAIHKLSKPEARIIMRLYYIDGYTWEQVEEKAHFSRRQCIRLRDYALVAMGIW